MATARITHQRVHRLRRRGRTRVFANASAEVRERVVVRSHTENAPHPLDVRYEADNFDATCRQGLQLGRATGLFEYPLSEMGQVTPVPLPILMGLVSSMPAAARSASTAFPTQTKSMTCSPPYNSRGSPRLARSSQIGITRP